MSQVVYGSMKQFFVNLAWGLCIGQDSIGACAFGVHPGQCTATYNDKKK